MVGDSRRDDVYRLAPKAATRVGSASKAVAMSVRSGDVTEALTAKPIAICIAGNAILPHMLWPVVAHLHWPTRPMPTHMGADKGAQVRPPSRNRLDLSTNRRCR